MTQITQNIYSINCLTFCIINLLNLKLYMTTIQDCLKQQREHINFDHEHLSQFIYGEELYKTMKKLYPTFQKIPYNWNNYNNGRVALIKEAYSVLPKVYNNFTFTKDHEALYMLFSNNHQMPGSAHALMFVKCIQLMGSQKQVQKFYKKSVNFQIVGAYAQTELGHGSDVRGIQTTATFDQKTQQFIINTPTISAAKYWPGELGVIANWALVYAQLILKGKNRGVQAFFVPIRDQNYNMMPNVEGGDIGPKFGYHAKQNGYLLFNNVRVPRDSILSRYNQVTPQGQLKRKGDQRIAYATMMKIRQFIAVLWPKIYASTITIATRYSIFRRQFYGGKSGQQQKIMDYQTQQDKIISRLAQFYTIAAAGHKVKALSELNQQLVTTKSDVSQMQETHIVLCFSKALFSEIILEGMQILRKSCGGHGFSNYAGINTTIMQFYTNPTHQGQNTILYLQVAKYIMKNYQFFMTKSKPVAESVKYIESIDYYQNYKCPIDDNARRWQANDIRILIAQGCCYLITLIAESMMDKEQGKSDLDVFNYGKGMRLQKLAILNGYHYTYDAYMQSIRNFRHEKTKQLLNDLCILFGINLIQSPNGQPILQGGFLNKQQISSLQTLKEDILKKLRPKLIGLVDGFGLPQHLIRSELTYGNPYENYFKLAKECEINKETLQAAHVIRKGIGKNLKNMTAKL